jgi:hypothetical protein
MDEEPNIQKLDQARNVISWKALLNGLVSTLWREIQHQYVLLLVKSNPGERWVRLLIQKLWDGAWDEWEHRNEVVRQKEYLVTQA